MSKTEKIRQLIDFLNYHTNLYNKGEEIISDKEWDNKYFELTQLEKEYNIIFPDSPSQSINYEVVTSLKKVEHKIPMLSLAKTKDFNEFIKYFNNKDVIGMLKLDGLSCRLKYKNNVLIEACTRGNHGLVGEDILHNARVVKNIPKRIDYTDELIIDGEIICTYKNFEPFSNEYKNPRNFASGSIRLLDSKECEKRNLSFVAWNIIKGFDDNNSFLSKLNSIEKLGFEITPYTSSFDYDAKDFLQDRAKELGYPIDGLVGRFDDIEYGTSLGSTDHHSRAAYAFKFYDEEYETTLIDIEWSLGRTGVLTPVAIFEPVDDGVSIIEKASLHNVSVMKDTLHTPFIGQKITVFKANQIIPQISWAETKELDSLYDLETLSIYMPEVCPICGKSVKLVQSDSGVENFICNNSDCEGKFLNKLEHYCGKSGFDIKGISKATLEKLMDWGWLDNYDDLYKLKNHRTEWINKSGFGPASVDKILAAIEESKNCTFESVISAFGIPLIGRTIAKVLVSKFKNYSDFRKAIEDDYKFYNLDGFGIEMHKALSDFDYTEMDNIVWDYLNIEYPVEKEEKKTAATLSGMKVCITGKLTSFKNRAELQTAIENAGGKAVTSVTKATNYLINNDFASESSKNISAKKLGIPILTEEDFIKKFLQEVENI